MATASEVFRGRRISVGRASSAETIWIVQDAADELEARAALEAAAPLTFDVYGGGLFALPRQDVDVTELGLGLWDGGARYGLRGGGVSSNQLSGSDLAVSFRTTGARHLVTTGRKLASYARTGHTAPDHGGAINVRDGRAEGVEVVVPSYGWSERWQLTNAQCSPAYRRALRSLTGTMNDYPFRDYDKHEVLFLGADGRRDRPDGDWDVEYLFDTQLNRTGLSFPPGGVEPNVISGVVKDGHDYAWVEFEEKEDLVAFKIRVTPLGVHIVRIYDETNFAALGIGT